MKIEIGKIYYTIVMYDLEGEEQFFKKKKSLKKVKKKLGPKVPRTNPGEVQAISVNLENYCKN